MADRVDPLIQEAFAAWPREGFLRAVDRRRASYDGPLEIVPELVEFGTANLARTSQPWASIRAADPEVLGDPAGAPWDRILVSAAPRHLPASLVAQLGEAGVMVIPVGSRMLRIANPGQVATEHGSFRFVPLR